MRDICASLRSHHTDIVFLEMPEPKDLTNEIGTAEALKKKLGVDKASSKTVFLPIQHADGHYGLVIRTQIKDHYIGEDNSEVAFRILDKARAAEHSAGAAVERQVISLPLTDETNLLELVEGLTQIAPKDLADKLKDSFQQATSPALDASIFSVSDLESKTPRRQELLEILKVYSVTKNKPSTTGSTLGLNESDPSLKHLSPKVLNFTQGVMPSPIANLGGILLSLCDTLQNDVANAVIEPGSQALIRSLVSVYTDSIFEKIVSYVGPRTDSITNVSVDFKDINIMLSFSNIIETYNKFINGMKKINKPLLLQLDAQFEKCIIDLIPLQDFQGSESTSKDFKKEIECLVDKLKQLKMRCSHLLAATHKSEPEHHEENTTDLNITGNTSRLNDDSAFTAGALTPGSAANLRRQSTATNADRNTLAEMADEEMRLLEERLREANEANENLRREFEKLKAKEQEHTQTRGSLEQKLEQLSLLLSSQKSSRTTPPNSAEPTPDTETLEALEREQINTQQLQQRLAEMGEVLETLKSEKIIYQTTAEEFRTEKDALLTELETLRQQCRDLNEELQTARGEAEEKEQTLQALQQKLARVESDLARAQTRTFNDTLGASMMAGNRSMMSQSIAGGGLSKKTQRAQALATQLEPFTTPDTDTQKQALVANILKLCGMLTDILDTFDNSITQHVQREVRNKTIELLRAELAKTEAMTRPSPTGLIMKTSYDIASVDKLLRGLDSALSTAKSSMNTIAAIDQRTEECAISLNDPVERIIVQAESFLALLTQYNKTLTEVKEAEQATKASDPGIHPLRNFTASDIDSLKKIFNTPHKRLPETLSPLQAQLNSDGMSLQTFSFREPMAFLELAEFLQPPTVNIDLYDSSTVDTAPGWETIPVPRRAEIKPDILYCTMEGEAVTYYFINPTGIKQEYSLSTEEMQDISLPPPRVLQNNPRQFFNSIREKLFKIAIKHKHISPLVNNIALCEEITRLCQLITEPTKYRLQKRKEHLRNIQEDMSNNFMGCLAHMKSALIPIEKQLKTHISSCIKNAGAARELLALTIRSSIATKFNLRSDQSIEGPAYEFGQRQLHASSEQTSEVFFKIDTGLVQEVISLLKKTNTDLQGLSPDEALKSELEDIKTRLNTLETLRDFIISDHNSTEDTALQKLKGKLIQLIKTAPNILTAIATVGSEIESYFNTMSNDHSKDESREYRQQYTKLTSNPALAKMDPQMIFNILSEALDGFVYENQNLAETLLLELQHLSEPTAAAAPQGRPRAGSSTSAGAASGGGSGRNTPTPAYFKPAPGAKPGSGRSTPTGRATPTGP